MGLPEHRAAAAQARVLVQMIPDVHYFSLASAHWHMDDNVRNYKDAAQDFHNAIYGRAKPSPSPDVKADSKLRSSPVELYKAHRGYARVLGFLGRFGDSVREYVKVLYENPYDFGAAFGLKQCLAKLSTTIIDNDVNGGSGSSSGSSSNSSSSSGGGGGGGRLSDDDRAAAALVLESSSKAYSLIAKEV